jgi:EmrB/QacA subfamily drug resistance transporter
MFNLIRRGSRYKRVKSQVNRSDGEENTVLALLIVVLGFFLVSFDLTSDAIALPSVGREFAMDTASLTWVILAYVLAAATTVVPFGRIADIHGRKKVFTCGAAVFAIASFLMVNATSSLMLIVCCAAEGVGAAMLLSTGIALLASIFPEEKRGGALGINAAAYSVGAASGPCFGGLITQQFGWRGIFLVNIPVGIGIVALSLLKMRGEWADARGERFDKVGALFYGGALFFVVYGISLFAEMFSKEGRLPITVQHPPTFGEVSGLLLLLVGIGGIVAFVLWEMRVPHPLLPVSLFKGNRTFAFSNMAVFIYQSGTFGVEFLLSLYLQGIKGLNPAGAGMLLLPIPISMTIFAPIAGRLSDTVEPRIISSVGLGVASAGLFLFATIAETTAVAFIIAGLIVLAFGFALFSSPNTNAVMYSVERHLYGVASASLQTMRVVGQVFSLEIVELVAAIYIGRALVPPASSLLHSISVTLTIFGVLCFGGMLVSLARGKVR